MQPQTAAAVGPRAIRGGVRVRKQICSRDSKDEGPIARSQAYANIFHTVKVVARNLASERQVSLLSQSAAVSKAAPCTAAQTAKKPRVKAEKEKGCLLRAAECYRITPGASPPNQIMTMPPLTCRVVPVTYAASWDAR